jgi:hypothetical protein
MVYAVAYAGGAPMKEHWLKVVTAKKTSKSTHIQIGKPKKFCRFFLGGSGLGNSCWQRQQSVLSSGFQVPQLVQFGIFAVSSMVHLGAW